jgi:hypothetical protein
VAAVRPASLYTEVPRGALAQLGERRLCKAEVAGSIPARSIDSDDRYAEALPAFPSQ